MKTIWKYKFGIKDIVTITLPKDAEILFVKREFDLFFLYALVDTENDLEDRYIEVVGTGQEVHCDIDTERKFIGTVQEPPFIWHIFERIP